MSVDKLGKSKKWRARTYFMGREVYLGMYTTKKEAERAVEEAHREFLNAKWDMGLIELRKGSSLWTRLKRRFKR